jgi:hypothetical protein
MAERQIPFRLTGDIVHGTCSTYTNHECRCAPCKEAMRIYSRDYKRTKRQMAKPLKRRLTARQEAMDAKQRLLRGGAVPLELDAWQSRS